MKSRLTFGLYIFGFFAFLFGPLLAMAVTAFNTPTYPQVWPFEGFTLEWFARLFADQNLMTGLQNSLIIGLVVVALSVPLGLAGALLMAEIPPRARGFYYLIVVSPVLTPGVIIGISTVIFWKDMSQLAGLGGALNGMILAPLAQSTFIASYCMLIFLSRLQRYDRTLEEAALDLGASRGQVFRHILLPFLRPAAISAAVIAFLSSFENYNTTPFAILADETLTTVLAGRVRQGMTPSVAALAVLIITVSVVCAAIFEIARGRRQERPLPAPILKHEGPKRGN